MKHKLFTCLAMLSCGTFAKTPRLTSVHFSFSRYDVVIDEIMADPSPPVSLPNKEWIELKNTSAATVSLQGWSLSDLSGQSGPMPSYDLKPDSFVIVCAAGSVPSLSVYGPTVAVTNFPSLDNTGDMIWLSDAQGAVIHSVNYSDTWYGNELKKGGGWTLEMIDTKNPCGGKDNWKAGTGAAGGTPAKQNSVDAINKDDVSPQLVRAYANNPSIITLLFDEPLDSLKAATAANYAVSGGAGITQTAVAVSPGFDKVALQLAAPLETGKIYTVTSANITDCAGNPVANNTARVGLPVMPDSLDIVINEVLFNPRPNGTDFVEIYNRSKRIVDLKELYIANRNNLGAISNITPLSAEDRLLFPEDHLVITEDPDIIRSQYITKEPRAFVMLNSMPSYNDDEGDVIILNAQGTIIDELVYNDDWHFKLIDNSEGVSLERISCNNPTQEPGNWHSAATSVGYATPTYKNSQYVTEGALQGAISVSPRIVSPDNDGMDDVATVSYDLPEPGYVANITVFDASGRPVRYLQRTALCGTKGSYRWDGLSDKGTQLPVGIYIIYTELFNLDGKKKQFKHTIVLARRK